MLVTVDFSADGGDALKLPADRGRPVGERPAGWSELVEGLEAPGDIRVMKRQWGAFYGTDLDLQLRRRGIQTIVLGGIATNMGVESTARPAWEHNYAVVIVEDLCSSLSAEMHAFAVQSIFPMIARVVQAADLRLGA